MSSPLILVSARVIDEVAALSPSLVSAYFDQPTCYQIAGKRFSPHAPHAVRVAGFVDESALERAIVERTLPQGTTGVLLDLEKWSLTPVAQQQDPATYYRRAAAAAHAAGLTFLAAPGTDLADVINPGSAPEWSRFVSSGLASQIAQHADIYGVQAQSLQASSSYGTYVSRIAGQVSAVNSGVRILAGLSTNPDGHVQSASVMLGAARSVMSWAVGWWLNDPGRGAACPKCSGPYPRTVLGFLQGLAHA